MPVGRSDGYLSTAWCHATCVMVKTRPEQRNTGEISMSQLTDAPAESDADDGGILVVTYILWYHEVLKQPPDRPVGPEYRLRNVKYPLERCLPERRLVDG
jgi:hypothetical protein